ncbi:MAG: Sec-independent protein translocase protein TatB [Betaproteobacteria bacterium]
MLDMSFSEIAVIGVVALVVLGPERLPKVARTAGHLFGRLQRYVATVKADINREMDTSELAKIKQEVQDAAKSFEQSVQQHANVVEKETSAIGHAIEKPATLPAEGEVSNHSQVSMLTEQENGLHESASGIPADQVEAPAIRVSPAHAGATATSASPVQVSLDFGIEPVRISRAT